MIQVKCMSLLAITAFCYACHSGKSEAGLATSEEKESAIFKEYRTTVVVKERNLRMDATMFALSSLPQVDSTVLTPVYIPMPGTDGKFSMLQVQRGSQYNILLTGHSHIFVNAGTLLFINFSAPKKNYIIQGKTWFKTQSESATIKADELTINLSDHSILNVDNYPNDSNIIISLIAGHATITRFGKTIELIPHEEMCLERATGKVITRGITIDAASWTIGEFRHFGVDFIYHMQEIGRLYDKDVYFNGINAKTNPLDFDYRHTSLEQMMNLYNRELDSAMLTLSWDSLKVSRLTNL